MHWWLPYEDTPILEKRSRLACVSFSLKAMEVEIHFSTLGNVSKSRQASYGTLQKERQSVYI